MKTNETADPKKIAVICSGCGKPSFAPLSAAGKRGKCAACGAVIIIPASEQTELEAEDPSDELLKRWRAEAAVAPAVTASHQPKQKRSLIVVFGGGFIGLLVLFCILAALFPKVFRPKHAIEADERERQKREVMQRASRERERAVRERERVLREGNITYTKYNQIHTGMTRSEVESILGPGRERSRSEIGDITTVLYEWQNPTGSNMNVMFQNGKVVQKAQFGLR